MTQWPEEVVKRAAMRLCERRDPWYAQQDVQRVTATLEDAKDDVLEVLDAIGGERAWLVGDFSVWKQDQEDEARKQAASIAEPCRPALLVPLEGRE